MCDFFLLSDSFHNFQVFLTDQILKKKNHKNEQCSKMDFFCAIISFWDKVDFVFNIRSELMVSSERSSSDLSEYTLFQIQNILSPVKNQFLVEKCTILGIFLNSSNVQ